MQIHPYYFSPQKRTFDFATAFLLLVLLSPVLFILNLIIFITTGRPILFKQRRTGQNGKVFTLLKLRTMTKNAAMLKRKYQHLNEAPAPMFQIHNDSRFVGIGKWLARTGLDDLPQLWNILKGEMSFVGPRPLPVPEAVGLSNQWREWRERVKPGVFSEWALSGERHETLDHWQALEKETLRTGSVATDFLYFLRTPVSQ